MCLGRKGRYGIGEYLDDGKEYIIIYFELNYN